MDTDSKSPGRRLRVSSTLIVLANLVPLVGVAFFEWDIFKVLALFWLENVFIGLFAVTKLAVSRAYREYREGLFVPLFFLVHYGGFMAGHGMVILIMYSSQFEDPGVIDPLEFYLLKFFLEFSWVAVVALFASHLWSFFTNFLGSDEKRQLTVRDAMAMPYRRMLITHIALLVGGVFLMEQGQPLVGIVLWVVMKIVLDVKFHRSEHRRLAGSG
ncbi:MAG: DUF6498-containing protein [Woeseiaceae bacterium]|nr:DUF6498-containing protein [Woeseiaceae bacterium]